MNKIIFVILLVFLLTFLNGFLCATEYSFERKNEALPKIGDTIGEINTSFNNGDDLNVVSWKLDSAGQWQDYPVDFDKITLKEINITGKVYYLLTIKNAFSDDDNFVIEKKEFNKFRKIKKTSKPQQIQLKVKYYVQSTYIDKNLISELQTQVNDNLKNKYYLYFNILPFYEKGVIRFHLVYDENNSVSRYLKENIFKTEYNEAKIYKFIEVFPLPKSINTPLLDINIQLSDEFRVEKGKLIPNPFTIDAQLQNKGGSTLYDISAEIQLPPGIILHPNENKVKFAEYDLKPEEKLNIKWNLKALNIEGELPINIRVKALKEFHKMKTYHIKLPGVQPTIYFKLEEKKQRTKKSHFSIDLNARNIQPFDKIKLKIRYEPEILKFIHVSRGNIFMHGKHKLPWLPVKKNKKGIIVFDQILPSQTTKGTLATLHFKILNKNDTSLILEVMNLEGYTKFQKSDIDLYNIKLRF